MKDEKMATQTLLVQERTAKKLVSELIDLKAFVARHSGTCLQSQGLGRLKQKDCKFQASLDNLLRTCLKVNKKGFGDIA